MRCAGAGWVGAILSIFPPPDAISVGRAKVKWAGPRGRTNVNACVCVGIRPPVDTEALEWGL